MWLDVASRGLSHHHVLSHPFKDWMTTMLNFPFHHEFIESLGRWTHILITLLKRYHGQADTAIPRYLLVTIREKIGIVKSTTVQNTAFTTQSNQLKKQYGQ
ncbi:hypothetical protein R2607_09620, partial [Streptococcus pyogenes]